MQPITVRVGPLATANDALIAASQAVAGAGNLTLTSTVVTLDTPRRVVITSAGNDTGITFTITGTTFSGQAASETITGANASVATSTIDFATVSSIRASGAAAGNVKAGTNTIAGSRWVRLDDFAPGQVGIQCTVSGIANYTLQSTMDDPNSPSAPVAITQVTWVNSSDTNVVTASTTQQTNFLFAPVFARVLLNSGAGSVTTTFVQSSNGPI